ncbi:MAG: NUDIX domain-containing protein, partial [Bacilli bacterium]|nr:NUDIX domain-containing protein [Bacilli bacterium]
MDTKIVLTGILKDDNEFLIVKRNENDELYPGAWEFPGGHLESGETIKDGLKRELFEEIGFNEEFDPIITHYYDEIKNKNGNLIYNLEIDFIINVNKNDINVILSNEHCDYKWVGKESSLIDDFIKDKLS